METVELPVKFIKELIYDIIDSCVPGEKLEYHWSLVERDFREMMAKGQVPEHLRETFVLWARQSWDEY